MAKELCSCGGIIEVRHHRHRIGEVLNETLHLLGLTVSNPGRSPYACSA
jgi:hypothetical protein